MLDEHSIQYAIENTQIIRSPERKIDTFGNTSFRFYLISELMDSVDQVRIRDGHVTAERPQIITPDWFEQEVFDGFGPKAEQFMEWARQNRRDLAILKYGFRFRKFDVTEEIVHSPVPDVLSRIDARVTESESPLSAIIVGVDEGWEVSLLKFTSELIEGSASTNISDWRRRGLL